jgi:hypothetical protein
MRRFARGLLICSALSLGLSVAGCESFDPTRLTDIFNTKRPLPGDRRPVFPEGVPGVTPGVPPELMRSNQPQPGTEPPPVVTAEPQPPAARNPRQAAIDPDAPAPPPKAKPKPKPKPKTAAKPKKTEQPAQQQQQQTQWPDPPQTRQQPQVQWPDPPPTR